MTQFLEYLEDNPAISYLLTAVIAVAAILLLYTRLAGDQFGGSGYAYFYDLSTQEVTVMSSKKLAPVVLSGGETAVTAWMYSCGDCDDQGEREIAYLEKYSDAARDVKQKYRPEDVPIAMAGVMMAPDYTSVSTPELVAQGVWAPAESREGRRIVARLTGLCDSGEAKKVCLP